MQAWKGALGDRELTFVAPFAPHGDGVLVFNGKSLELTSANSLLGKGQHTGPQTAHGLLLVSMCQQGPWARP